MKTDSWRQFLLLFVALTGLVVSSARSEAGSIWISSSPSDISPTYWAPTMQVFDFYVIADSIPDGMQRYEFGIESSPAMAIITTDFPNNCVSCELDGRSAIISLAGCVPVNGSFLLLHATAIYVASLRENETLCMGASDPSSLNPASPLYQACDQGLQRFEVLNRCLHTPVPIQQTTFGALRAQY
jgi:hypothetical protein